MVRDSISLEKILVMKNIFRRKNFFRTAVCILLIFSFSSQLFAATDSDSTTPEPYKENEFPQWAKDLRDTEIITFGSLPFITLGVTLGYSLIVLVKNNFDSTYVVNPFVKDKNYTQEEQVGIIITSASICVGIGVTNLIINLVKRNAENKRNKQFLHDNIKITTIDNELNIIPIPPKYKRDKSYKYGNIEDAVF